MPPPLCSRLRVRALSALVFAPALAVGGPATAQPADPPTPLVRILARPLPACTEGAFRLLSRQMRTDAPRVVVDAMRRTQALGDAWAPGDPTYDRARGMVAAAFDDYEKAHGALAPTSYRDVAERVFNGMRPEILALLADVFERPGGQLYWNDILGGAECGAVLDAILPGELEPAERFSYDRFRAQAQAAHGDFRSRLPALSAEDRQDFDAGGKQLAHGIIGGPGQAAALVGAPLQANARKALAPLQAYLRGVLESWRAEHAPAAVPPGTLPPPGPAP